MASSSGDRAREESIEKIEIDVLGYLNLSEGADDPHFARQIDRLFRFVVEETPEQDIPHRWEFLRDRLFRRLQNLSSSHEPFRDAGQAWEALRLTFDHVLPGYTRFHEDLLHHQSPELLWNTFFIAGVFNMVLRQRAEQDDEDRKIAAILEELNDFVGYRPVAVLESDQKMQPYPHERVGLIPLYKQGAGTAHGPYEPLIRCALEILENCPEDIAHAAQFEFPRLGMLGCDPRAYDFSHPVHRRPNHLFGEWDPHHLNEEGYYDRFVVRQIVLAALMDRVAQRPTGRQRPFLYEAGVALAGIVLMASGTSGRGPGTHDSSMNLAVLVRKIAAYRDEFYDRLLETISGNHGTRLKKEAEQLHQSFGGVRQHLNLYLAARRANQQQHAELAPLFSKLDCPDQAMEHARAVDVPAVRMQCIIRGELQQAISQIESEELTAAAARIEEAVTVMQRGIQCGALADPWSILGFQGNFSLFPAVENSVRDHRVDELVDLVNDILTVQGQLWSAASAQGTEEVAKQCERKMRELAVWWDQFGSMAVAGIGGFSGRDLWESYQTVSRALHAWHQDGAAAGQIAFWQPYAEAFETPRAFGTTISELLRSEDYQAAMALCMNWIGQADAIPLEDGYQSLHDLIDRWLTLVLGSRHGSPLLPGLENPESRWELLRKFFDYLEANAEEWWQVPRLEIVDQEIQDDEEWDIEEEPDEEDEEDGLFGAAYENVIYRDTTENGFEGSLMDHDALSSQMDLDDEVERLVERLDFIRTMHRSWVRVLMNTMPGGGHPHPLPANAEVLDSWRQHVARQHRDLLDLLKQVDRLSVAEPEMGTESRLEFEQLRILQDSLLDKIGQAASDAEETVFLLTLHASEASLAESLPDYHFPVIAACRAIWEDVSADKWQEIWNNVLEDLRKFPLLYAPLATGGDPSKAMRVRGLQRLLRLLLESLPRVGKLVETCQLLDAILQMESRHTAGPGGISEFDRLFEAACRSLLEAITSSSLSEDAAPVERGPAETTGDLLQVIERLNQTLLQRWLTHSRTLRISSLERVVQPDPWDRLVEFIRKFGADLFTQSFLGFRNLRSIRLQGIDDWLDELERQDDPGEGESLAAGLRQGYPRGQAVTCLEIILDAVLENYGYYRDYNSTTSQSDHGDQFDTLLDFLRLVNYYNRVAWNLRPLVMAHDELLRAGQMDAAAEWRKAFETRTEEVARDLLKKYELLAKKYGMRIPSIHDRLNERFVHPLKIDRLRSMLVNLQRTTSDESRDALLENFQEEIEAQLNSTCGSVSEGIPWIMTLSDEADQDAERVEQLAALSWSLGLPRKRLSLEEIHDQLQQADQLLDDSSTGDGD